MVVDAGARGLVLDLNRRTVRLSRTASCRRPLRRGNRRTLKSLVDFARKMYCFSSNGWPLARVNSFCSRLGCQLWDQLPMTACAGAWLKV